MLPITNYLGYISPYLENDPRVYTYSINIGGHLHFFALSSALWNVSPNTKH